MAVCLIAPFFPAWRLFGPWIRRGRSDTRAVALTFDDGPDPALTPAVLDLLDRYEVKATFFVVGQRAERQPQLVREILDRGHSVGNHSQQHDPLLMLRSSARLGQEIDSCQRILRSHGVRPLCFRPPVGIVSPRLWPALLRLGLLAVGFSRRAADFGNRRVHDLAHRLLVRVRPGDILLLHDRLPRDDEQLKATVIEQLERLLDGLQQRGLGVDPLAKLIGQPVVEPIDNKEKSSSVGRFYDALAPEYDAEQEAASASPVRRAERAAVEARLGDLLADNTDVLEVGAGTGRFTLSLVADGARVTALDLSPAMLDQLARKAEAAGVRTIEPLVGDLTSWQPEREYGLVCSFSALEYIADLDTALARVAHCLAPGGVLYVTTAHRNFFRFFVQIGNAMRQGVWLCARSKSGMRRALVRAGLRPELIRTHAAGMLLEVVARKPG